MQIPALGPVTDLVSLMVGLTNQKTETAAAVKVEQANDEVTKDLMNLSSGSVDMYL